MIINNFKNIYDKYNEHRKLQHLKPIGFRELARLTNTSRSSLYSFYRNKSKGIQFNTLNNLIHFFGVPLNNLIEYRSNPYKFKLTNFSSITSNHKLTKRQKLMSNISVILYSVDFDIPIAFTPLEFPNASNSSILRFSLAYSTLNPSNVTNNRKVQNIIYDFSNKLMNYLTISVVLHGSMVSRKTASKYMDYELWGNVQNPVSSHVFTFKHSMNGISHVKLTDIIKQRKHKYPYKHHGFCVTSTGNQQKIYLFDNTTPNFAKK